jgi:hypothetical protein
MSKRDIFSERIIIQWIIWQYIHSMCVHTASKKGLPQWLLKHGFDQSFGELGFTTRLLSCLVRPTAQGPRTMEHRKTHLP